MFFQIIETSSSGNCAFLSCGGVNVLIDAGIGVRKLEAYLKSRGMRVGDIDAIFITHEHGDHCRALKSLKKYSSVKIFANRLTAESIMYLEPDTKCLSWQVFENGSPFNFMDLEVFGFSIPHDTSDAVGYKIKFGGKSIVWLTDLGKLTLSARDVAMGANILVLESNYCPKMLENSSRPYSLKQRIKGSHGHLSNSDAISLLKDLNAGITEKIYLAHISKECNSVSHISELIAGISIRDIIEIVSPYSEPSSPYED